MAAQVGWPIGRLVSHKCQPDSVSITAIVAASVCSADDVTGCGASVLIKAAVRAGANMPRGKITRSASPGCVAPVSGSQSERTVTLASALGTMPAAR